MGIMVSIIMPVYNVEKYISQSIQSVLQQTYGNFELLIINDGSPDNSVKMAEEYAKQDTRIKIINKTNGGLSDARNVGMEHAQGKYIYFLDSDDYIEPNLLELVVNKAEGQKAEVVLFSYFVDYVEEIGNIKESKIVSIQDGKYIDKKMNSIPLSKELLPMIGFAWNKLYNKSFIDRHKVKFIKGISLIEDILFNEIILANTRSMVTVSTPLYHYIQRERITLANVFYKNSYELQLKSLYAREQILKSWSDDIGEINKIIAYQHVQSIRFCCSNMFYYQNEMKLLDKYKYIKYMLKDRITKERIKFYSTTTPQDRLIRSIIKYRCSVIVAIVYLMNSKKHLNRSIV